MKLINVLSIHVNVGDQKDFMPIVIKMENCIKAKGALPVGPLIQKTEYEINEDGKLCVEITFMRQANNFIHNIETPYTMESVLRVKDCMYARYSGPEEKLKLAYDKINVTAFEEGIELGNTSYTVFVDKQDDNIVADVFVEKKTNE